jgi:hypothetical protein
VTAGRRCHGSGLRPVLPGVGPSVALGRSFLAQHGLDLDGDLHLVADDHTAAVERHLDVDAEIVAVDGCGGWSIRDITEVISRLTGGVTDRAAARSSVENESDTAPTSTAPPTP